jgi:hypothetical protein
VTLADFALIAGPLLLSLGRPLVLTIIVELAIAAGALGLRRPLELAVLALINVITNPALNMLLAFAMATTGSTSLRDPLVAGVLGLLELAVVLVEWRMIAWALPELRSRALGIAIITNAASLIVGLAVFGTG